MLRTRLVFGSVDDDWVIERIARYPAVVADMARATARTTMVAL